MQVTKISPYDYKRMKVTLDEGAVTFLLYNGEIKKLGVQEGTELDEKAWAAVLDVLTERAEKRTLYYMRSGDKTEAEVRGKLRSAMYPKECIDRAVAFCGKYRLLDDERYAGHYVDTRKDGLSRRELAFKLKVKGISLDTIEAAVEQVSGEDETAACRKLLEKRMRGSHRNRLEGPAEEAQAEKNKTFAYLARHGFSYDVISKAWSELESIVQGEGDAAEDKF